MTHTVTADDLYEIATRIFKHDFSLEFWEDVERAMDRFEIDNGSVLSIVRSVCGDGHWEKDWDAMEAYVRKEFPQFADKEEYETMDEIEDEIGYDSIIFVKDDDGEVCLVNFS